MAAERKEVAQMTKRGKNIYKRKDGRWEARRIKGYNEQGKALYAYFYGQTYAEARNKLFAAPPRIESKRGCNFAEADSALCFGDALDLWLNSVRDKLKTSSYVKYFNQVHNHIKPALGQYPLANLTSEILNGFAAEKRKNGKRDATGGLSEKTVKDLMATIKAVFRFAKGEALLADADISLNLPRQKRKEIRVLFQDEQAALEKYLRNGMDECKLGVLLCLYTGLRIGELCALKWADIAMGDGALTVRRTMQRIQTFSDADAPKTKIFVTSPKSERSVRTIPLPEFLINRLKPFHPSDPNAYFLTGDPERRMEPRAYYNRFQSYIAACGIENMNFHGLRHTFATRCVEVGFEIKSLSEILGHANIKITLERYVHPSLDLKRTNMNKLSESL